jgi:hypothetical protein
MSRCPNKNVCGHIPISTQCLSEAYDALIPKLFDESVSSIKYCLLHWRGSKTNSLASKARLIIRPWILSSVFRSLRCILAVTTFRDFGLVASLNDCLSLYWQRFYYLFFKINGGGWDRSWYHLNTWQLPTTKWHRLHYKDNQSSDDGSRVNCRNVV